MEGESGVVRVDFEGRVLASHGWVRGICVTGARDMCHGCAGRVPELFNWLIGWFVGKVCDWPCCKQVSGGREQVAIAGMVTVASGPGSMDGGC